MPTYITLTRWTQKGIENVKGGPGRLDAVRQAAKAAGVELKAYYLTLGQYDGVAVFDAPNDEAVARLALGFGAQGNVRSETMRAFTEDEYRKLVASLP